MGFRAFAMRTGKSFSVRGRVWNNPDGTVGIHADAPSLTALTSFRKELSTGPGAVELIEAESCEPGGYIDFRVSQEPIELPGLFSRFRAGRGGLVVLLHGLGSNEDDLFGLAQELELTENLLCLRAPFRYEPGYAWFEISWDRGVAVDGAQANQSLRLLTEEIVRWQVQTGCGPAETVLGGFSQGAMMTHALITQHPALVGGAVLLSGAPNPIADPFVRPQIPIFQAHGTEDPVLPIQFGRMLRDAIAGPRTTYREYPMAHSVTIQTMSDLQAWFEEWRRGNVAT